MARPTDGDQRLSELAIVLTATENFLENTMPGDVWLPAPSSRAAEMRQLEAEVSSDDIGWNSSVMMLMAMLDHMKTVAALLGPGNNAIFGTHVITRSCLEAAARLRWVIEPGISPESSLQRAHQLRCDGLAYQVKMYRALDADAAAIEGRVEHFEAAVELAKLHGVTVFQAPGHTNLMRELFSDPLAREIGAGIYNMLSGISHSSPPSLMEFFKESVPATIPVVEQADEATFVQPAIALDQFELAVHLAAFGISKTIDALMPFTGWSAELWPNWRRHLLETAFRGVEAPDPAS